LLERNGLPAAMRPDDAGVREARAGLASVPLAQRMHESLLRRVPDTEPSQDLPSRLGGALVFAASGAGPMPEHASATGFRRRLAPKIDTVFDDLASEAGWVL